MFVLVLTGCQGWSPKELERAAPQNLVWALCNFELDPVVKSTGARKESMENFRNELKKKGVIDYKCISLWDSAYSYETEDEFCTNEPNSGGLMVGDFICTKKVAEKPNEPEPSQKKLDKIILLGTGTGFLINNSGYIVSNNHVAGVCKKVEAIYNNETLTADLIANDKVNDLAIAKINTSKRTKHLNISSGSKFGEDIKVYGFPLTNRLGSGLKVTKGIVSSLNGPGNNYSLIQIDAPIQPGNSGGPILNKNGNLVGVAVASISTPLMMSDTTIIPQNINFGVKSETLSNFLKANSIKYNSNDKPIAESDNLALQSTVQLNCYNTLREARKFKEQGLVRNILED
jgi:S1-C subfamily serine protease